MAVVFRPKRPDQFGAMAGVGQEEPLPPLGLSARYVIRQETSAGAQRNGRNAPKAAIWLPGSNWRGRPKAVVEPSRQAGRAVRHPRLPVVGCGSTVGSGHRWRKSDNSLVLPEVIE